LSRRKVPVFLQQQRAECGLVSLAMVASYFDARQSVESLRSSMTASSRGADLGMLLRLAAKTDLVARPVRLDLDDLRLLQLPAILHWEMDHFVVLVRVKRRGIIIHDPALGRRLVSLREVDECFTGVAVEFRPGPDFARSTLRKPARLWHFLNRFQYLGRYTTAMLGLLLAIQILSLAPAIATQMLIDEVVLGQDQAWLFRALAGVAAIMLIVVVLETLRQRVTLYSGTRLAFDSSSMVVRHLFRLPPSFFHARHPGDVLSKLDSLTPIRQALTQHGVNAIVHTTVIATTLAIMLFYSGVLTVVTVVGLSLASLVRAVLLPVNRRLNEEALIHGARQDSSLLETIRAYDSVRLHGLMTLRLADWQRHFAAATNARTRSGRLLIWSNAGTSIVSVFEQMLFLGIGIAGIAEKQITLGVLFAFMSLRGRLSAAAMQLSTLLQDLFMLKTHTGRLSDIVLAEPVRNRPQEAICSTIRGHIDVSEVSFRYEDGPLVIENLSCVIEAGEHVAITGPSGCGKSTLLGLLCGQLPAASGSISVDGNELDLWDSEALSNAMAVVLQNDALFAGSILENICGFSASPDIEAMRDAAIRAAIWAEIRAMPMMHNTRIGDMQGGLSGGQRQRIILARAFYRRPRILLMDEATSHLDGATEKRVLDSVDELGITAISVTHRAEVARRANRVLQLPG